MELRREAGLLLPRLQVRDPDSRSPACAALLPELTIRIEIAHRPGAPVGVPIAGDDPKAIAVAESLIREIGFEPVLVGGLAMGRHLVPGTPLGGEHTPAEIRQIAPSLR